MVEVETFGEIHIRAIRPGADREDASSALLGRSKPLALFLYLITNGRARSSRRRLIELFWPALDEGHARNALSKTLGRIREALGDGVIVADIRDVGFDAARVRTDLQAFAAAAARDDPAGALALFRGDFLHGLVVAEAPGFDQWLDGMRAGLRHRATALARLHAHRLRSEGRHADAGAHLGRAIAWAPADEALSRDLLTTLAAAGDLPGAVSEFRRLEDVLATQLGAVTADATRDLFERIRARRPVTGTNADSVRAGAWPRSLAVLPFANLTGSADQEFFADGMTEALIAELARSATFRVISRQSVLGFRDSRQSLDEIASALDVDAVIEGSVVRAGDVVRITAQLVRVAPEAHLWAGTWDRPGSDILALQADVARGIADAIRGIAGERESAAPPPVGGRPQRPVDPAAYEAYLKGRHFSLRPPSMDRAVRHFRDAIELDPGYAPAWSGLAAAYANLALFAYLSPADALPALRGAVERALSLDPGYAEAVAVRGVYRMLADRDWTGARSDLASAVECCPESVDARLHYVVFLAAMGDFDTAFAQHAAAAGIDPIGPATRFTLAWALYKARRHGDALRALDALVDLHPGFSLAWPYAAVCHALMGDAAAAHRAAATGIEALPCDHEALALGAAAFGLTGAGGAAADAYERLLAIGETRYLDPWAPGVACAGMGDADGAAHWFRRMYDERSPSAFCVRDDPLLEPLRSHLVFRTVVKRLAFPRSYSP